MHGASGVNKLDVRQELPVRVTLGASHSVSKVVRVVAYLR